MELPDEVVNKIIRFMSHPCADMIKKEVVDRVVMHLRDLSELKVYQLYNSAKFSWEVEVLEYKINLIELARIERERLEEADEAERFADDDDDDDDE